MACNILFAPLTMATTQLARVVSYAAKEAWTVDENTERNLRMSWVVTTDNSGHRTLRMRWISSDRSDD